MEDTPPGRGRRERRCRPRRRVQPPEAPTFVRAQSQKGGVAGAPSPTPPLACLRGSDLSGGRERAFLEAALKRPEFTQELPRKLLPMRAKEAQSHLRRGVSGRCSR